MSKLVSEWVSESMNERVIEEKQVQKEGHEIGVIEYLISAKP